jgi:hypothetical protein
MLVVGVMVCGFFFGNDLHDGGILRGEGYGFLCSGWWFGYWKVFPLLVRTLLERFEGHRALLASLLACAWHLPAAWPLGLFFLSRYLNANFALCFLHSFELC